MLKFISITLLIALGNGMHIGNNNDVKCNVGGPNYWCKNKETAILCRAVPYCQENVWSIKQVSDDCGECMGFMKMVHESISNNQIKQIIIHGATSICLELPNGYQDMCKTMMRNYAVKAIDQVEHLSRNASDACSKIGFCGSKINQKDMMIHVRQIMKKMFKTKGTTDYCTTCEQYVGTVHLILDNPSTKTEVLNELTSLCTQYVKTAEICSFVNALGGPLYDKLVVYLAIPQKLCTTLGLCSGSNEMPLFNIQKSKNIIKFTNILTAAKPHTQYLIDNETCTICLKTVKLIRDILNDNTVRKYLKDAAENICSALPPEVFSYCLAYIDKKVTSRFDQFVKDLNPRTTCKHLDICPNSTNLNNKPTNFNGELCEACKFGMNYVVQMLKENATKQELKNAVLGLCSDLPPSVSEMCTTYVNTYWSVVIEVLISELGDTNEICTTLHLCTAKTEVHLHVTKPTTKKIVKANPVGCEVCEYAMNYLDQALSNNATEQEIIAALDSVCSKLPSSLSGECTSLINEYGQAILQLLISELKPALVCKELGLCSSSRSLHLKKIVKANPVECEVCEYAMNYLDQVLSNNATEQEIISALDSVCSKLPSSLSGECTSLINEYGQAILQLLITELKPALVCKELGLCSSSRSFKVKASVKSNPITCEVCKYAMSYLDSMLVKNSTEEDVKKALDSLCAKLPSSMSSECETLVNTYADQIIKLIVQDLADPTTLCKDLGLCSSSSKQVKSNPITCEVCKYAMSYLDSMLVKNSTEEDVKKALDSLCAKLPSSMSSECETLVNTYADQIIKLIVQDLADPTTLCKDLGLCSSSSKQVKSNPITCEVCKYAMSYLDSMLVKNSTEEDVKKALDSLCAKLPSSMSSECETLVNTYADQIIKLIVQDLADPTTLCKDLGLCSSSSKQVKSNPITCEVCKYAMSYLDSMLVKNSTEEDVKKALDSLCAKLPSSMSSECETLVNTYADQIIKLIVQDLADPTTLCKDLGLCSSKDTKKLQKSTLKANPVTCEICEMAMQYLDSMLSNNSTEGEIRKGLDQLCGYLPESVRGECTSLVDQYTDTIVKLILQELKPDAICKELQLCAAKTKVSIVQKSTLKANPVTCEICEMAMQYLDSMLSNNSTEDEIRKGLDQLCGYLPESVRGECTSLVDQYTDTIVKLILQELKPDAICKALALCASSDKDDFPCEVCSDFLEVLENIIKENKTEAVIKEGLDKLCSLVPASISKKCDSFVEFYGSLILNMLLNEISPDKVCKELKLCPQSTKVKTVTTVHSPKSEITCEFCKYAITFLDNQLKTERTEEKIKEALEGLCTYLPSSVSDQCDSLVKLNTDVIVKLLIRELNPSVICNELKVCSSVQNKKEVNFDESLNDSCDLCHAAIEKLVTELKDNATSQEIKSTLKEMCMNLPTHLNDECVLLVNEYYDQLVDILTSKDAQFVCVYLGLCASTKLNKKLPLKHELKVKINPVTCELCSQAIKYLDSVLTEKSTEDEIKKEVVSLCSHLPSAFENECDALIAEYGDELIKLVVQQIQPDKICKALKIC